MRLIVPTEYSVTAAAATIARPGSTLTLARTSSARQASSSTFAHTAIVGASSPWTYATPRPPPSTSSGRSSGAAKPAITSAARPKLSAAKTLEPMWQCRPMRRTDDDRRARSTAARASPLPRLKPNFESSCPVAMYSWVWACTPGVTRRRTSGTAAPAPWMASRRSSSSKLSTTR